MKDDKDTKKSSKLTKGRIIVACVVCLFIILLWIPHGKSGQDTTTASAKVTASEPMSGIIIAKHGEWQSVSSFNYRIDMSMLDYDIRWLVRLDGDDNRVYHMYPRGWRPGSHLEETNGFNVIEVKLPDDEPAATARIAWAKSARCTVPSS